MNSTLQHINLHKKTLKHLEKFVNPVLGKNKSNFEKELVLRLIEDLNVERLAPREVASIVKTLAHSSSLGWSLAFLSHLCLSLPALRAFATDNWQLEVLNKATNGKALLAWAVTEPLTGSDISAARPGIKRKNNKLTVNVHKRYITNGSSADNLILHTTDDSGSSYLLLLDATNVNIKRNRIITSGFVEGDTADIVIDDLEISEQNILAKDSDAGLALYQSLERERLFAAIAVSEVSNIVLNRSKKFLKETVRNKEALFKKSSIYHRYVDLKVELLAADALVNETFNLFCHEEKISMQSAAIKIKSFSLAQQTINQACQWYGAQAFKADHWLAKLRNDAQAFTLAAGPTEVMKELIYYYEK